MENYISYLMTFLLFENIHRKLPPPQKKLIQFLVEIILSEISLYFWQFEHLLPYDSFSDSIYIFPIAPHNHYHFVEYIYLFIVRNNDTASMEDQFNHISTFWLARKLTKFCVHRQNK